MTHLKSDTDWTSPYVEKILFLPISALYYNVHVMHWFIEMLM